MRFRIEVICVNDDAAEQRDGVMELERNQLVMETLGLTRRYYRGCKTS